MRFRRFELDAVTRRLARSASVADLRQIARRRLPGGVFDYIDGAAEDEITAGRNVEAFRRIEFRPRVLRNVSQVDPSATILGRRVPLPLILSPTGFTRMANSQGELAVARAAARAGLPYVLSSLSTRSIEEVRAVSTGDLWFQVYVWRDKELLAEMLQRATAAEYSTIMITVDTAVLGRRERDLRSGFTLPPKLGLDTLLDGVLHPGWTLDFLRGGPISFANVTGKSVGDGSDPVALADYMNSQFDPSLSWSDVEWFRERWDGKIVLKGIQTVEDAVLAADNGIDAIALSNHGGRQLDGAPPPIELVAPVRHAVGDALEIYCDGGVRRGSDVVKALALGANAAMSGRAYLYGLAAGGERGVDHVLALLDEGIRQTLVLTGSQGLDALGPELVGWRDG
ncbi:MAG: alpha-hydroxy-acid oxidizing protein [Deltaproteobacteria bacterium]|nr:alpha-hydroxy-acid oxidizing protein [Deltaproteobacteria bacterium]MBW2415346.1 alpha-hydroxy-acid oxidizing protein [Deltaproteobacteria bacterium]